MLSLFCLLSVSLNSKCHTFSSESDLLVKWVVMYAWKTTPFCKTFTICMLLILVLLEGKLPHLRKTLPNKSYNNTNALLCNIFKLQYFISDFS